MWESYGAWFRTLGNLYVGCYKNQFQQKLQKFSIWFWCFCLWFYQLTIKIWYIPDEMMMEDEGTYIRNMVQEMEFFGSKCHHNWYAIEDEVISREKGKPPLTRACIAFYCHLNGFLSRHQNQSIVHIQILFVLSHCTSELFDPMLMLYLLLMLIGQYPQLWFSQFIPEFES